MKANSLFVIILPATLAACTGPTRTSPTLTAPAAATSQSTPTPTKRGFFEEAGDTTWRVVTAPALLIPSKKPATSAPPEVYDAPNVTIVRRNWSDDPDLVPPSTPAQSPSPATRPATP